MLNLSNMALRLVYMFFMNWEDVKTNFKDLLCFIVYVLPAVKRIEERNSRTFCDLRCVDINGDSLFRWIISSDKRRLCKHLLQGTISGRQFLWGIGLPKGNGGVQRFPRARRRLALECNYIAMNFLYKKNYRINK